MIVANNSCSRSAGSCLNDQATLLEYNTLIGVYQIGVYFLLSFFRSDDRPFIDNYVQLSNLNKMLNFILLSKPHPSLLIKAHFLWHLSAIYLLVPYRDRPLGEPLAGLRRPIRRPLGSRGMGLEEFYTGQRQKCMVWTAPIKELFKTVVEPLISLPKYYFWIQKALICVYHINLKAHLFTPIFTARQTVRRIKWYQMAYSSTCTKCIIFLSKPTHLAFSRKFAIKE